MSILPTTFASSMSTTASEAASHNGTLSRVAQFQLPKAADETNPGTSAAANAAQQPDDNKELRDAVAMMFGQVFFGQMMKSMRSTLEGPAYIHGGSAEEIFQSQLDQVIGERMANAQGGQMSESIYNQLARMPRR